MASREAVDEVAGILMLLESDASLHHGYQPVVNQAVRRLKLVKKLLQAGVDCELGPVPYLRAVDRVVDDWRVEPKLIVDYHPTDV